MKSERRTAVAQQTQRTPTGLLTVLHTRPLVTAIAPIVNEFFDYSDNLRPPHDIHRSLLGQRKITH